MSCGKVTVASAVPFPNKILGDRFTKLSLQLCRYRLGRASPFNWIYGILKDLLDLTLYLENIFLAIYVSNTLIIFGLIFLK